MSLHYTPQTRLEQIRRLRRLTKKELAKKANILLVTLNRAEDPRSTPPSYPVQKSLLRVLGIPWLLHRDVFDPCTCHSPQLKDETPNDHTC